MFVNIITSMTLVFTKLYYCTKVNISTSKQLYKYLLRECSKLPKGPKEHYAHAIKQSFKQHVNESDSQRINQMITKTLDDAHWILDKYLGKKVPLATAYNALGVEGFWNSVFLYYSSPHLVNRRVLGISPLFCLEINFKKNEYKLSDILKYSELYSQVYRLKSISSENINESIVDNIFEQYGNNFSSVRKDLNEVMSSHVGVFVCLRILLPRSNKLKKCAEFVIIDKQNNIATFSAISNENEPALCPNFSYEIELDKANFMKICVPDVEFAEHKASEWLANVLFPKLISWTAKKTLTTPVQKSLALISVEKYCNLYHELKQKYGENIIKNWPENTDPLKFVHEDVAIATYLLILWQKTSEKKQKFVDLGCGNGLLVHILNGEGHCGYGIDVRPRKIWSMYPESTVLKVETIIPSSKTIYPDVDWLIGNHSDELTPWIPVMAARSSKTCKFFLLPCCSYEFDGRKYQRTNSSQSQYHEYLDYVRKISDECGFKTEIDRLRIPSTKRICLVGSERTCEDKELDSRITELITKRCASSFTNNPNDNDVGDSDWVANYKARSSTEVVRNCTKLDKTLLESIVTKVASHLLSHTNNVATTEEKMWNSGGTIPLPDLVKLLPPEELKQLKKECGGLQTLLKNHHEVFIVKSGSVQIRMPTVNNKGKFKTRECWFYKNHPNGCPLMADSCAYLHSQQM